MNNIDLLEDKFNTLVDDYIQNSSNPTDTNFMTNSEIWNSKLYQFVKEMPKGAELHVHGIALLPIPELIDYLCQEPDIMVSTNKSLRPRLEHISTLETRQFHSESNNIPEYMTMKDALNQRIYSRDEIITKFSLLGCDPNTNTWTYFDKLFDEHLALGTVAESFKRYYIYAFKYYISLNVMHIDLKTFFSGDNDEALRGGELIKQAYYEVKKEHPNFTITLVGLCVKRNDVPMDVIDNLVDNILYVHKNLMDDIDSNNITPLVKAIDFVQEEDKSRTLEELKPVFENIKSRCPSLKLDLHAGETLLENSTNLYTAYELGASRVGHGFNLYRFPDLIEKYIDSGIGIEVCPVSNCILGYAPDLTQHPASKYIRQGLNISICSDDPAYMEHTTLVDDYFAAIVNWNLNIKEVYGLCRNSIELSFLDDKKKLESLNNFEKDWNQFVDDFIGQ